MFHPVEERSVRERLNIVFSTASEDELAFLDEAFQIVAGKKLGTLLGKPRQTAAAAPGAREGMLRAIILHALRVAAPEAEKNSVNQ